MKEYSCFVAANSFNAPQSLPHYWAFRFLERQKQQAESLSTIRQRRLPSLFATDPARYWAEMRTHWPLAADHVSLNCGSVGCVPLPVLRAMIENILECEEFREASYPWFGYDKNEHLQKTVEALAAFVNASRDEIAHLRATA